MSSDQEIEELLDDKLADWELAREAGKELAASELCADVPYLTGELQRRIESLRATSWMLVDQADEAIDGTLLHDSFGETIWRDSDKTIPEFVSSITDSGILTGSQLDELQQCVLACDSDSVTDVAETLVSNNLLTEYQANVLLKRSKSPLVLDRYVILDSLGSGGMGLVFKALHRSMERIVAIKVLPEFAVDSPDKVKRFQREVKSAAKLSHPNVVAAYDSYQRNGTYFLVMEYVDGVNLHEHVREHGPISVGQAIKIVDRVSAGLNAAHQLGIVHRDVKPTNIMLTSDGTPKLLDLGLARTMQWSREAPDLELTRDGLAMGTASYMPPEQALDAKNADVRSDIYSLGCTLYFLLTGHSPFERNTTVQTIVAHRESAAPPLNEKRDGVPPAVEAVYQKMVQKRPEDRYQSTSELRADLEAIASDQGESKSSQQPLAHSGLASASGSDRLEPVAEQRAPLWRRFYHWPLVTLGIAAALFGLFVAVSWLWLDDQGITHRDVARWALAKGGAVTIKSEMGLVNLDQTSDFPEGELHIIGLELNADSRLFSIEPIFQIESLETLRLTGFDEIDVNQIASLKQLTTLSLDDCGVTDSQLQVLVSLESLQKLSLIDAKITDVGLSQLTKLTNLTFLDLSGTQITRSGIQVLNSIPTLDMLDLTMTKIQDDDLPRLPQSLSWLILASSDIGDGAIQHLNHFERLQFLNLSDTNVTEAGLRELAVLPELSDLSLGGVSMSPEAIRHLGIFPALFMLTLSGNELDEEHLAAIAELKDIEYLDLSTTNLDDDALMRLAQLRRLNTINITDTNVTESGIDRFMRKRPNCEVLVDDSEP